MPISSPWLRRDRARRGVLVISVSMLAASCGAGTGAATTATQPAVTTLPITPPTTEPSDEGPVTDLSQLPFEGTADSPPPDVAGLGPFAATMPGPGSGHIFLLDSTGESERLTPRPAPGFFTSGPAWSPDGSKIAFAMDVGPDYNLWIIDQGGDLTKVTDLAGISASVTWSPGGDRLAFAFADPGGLQFNTLNIVDLSSGAVTAVDIGLTGMSSVEWAPDQDRLLVSADAGSGRQLYVVDIGEEAVTQLTNTVQNIGSGDWSPDGSEIAFAADGAVYVLSLGDGGYRVVSPPAEFVNSPTWSADGRWIAYLLDSDTPVIVAADGSTAEPYLVTDDQVFSIDWQP